MNHSTVALNAPSLAAVTTLFVYVKRCRMSINVTKQECMKTNQVAASSESVVNPLPVRAFVPRGKFRKFLVRSCDQLLREQIVKLAGIEEQRCFALLDVCLPAHWSAGTHEHLRGSHIEILGLKEGRVCNDRHADNVLESEVENEAG
jgi:hypothetical protein